MDLLLLAGAGIAWMSARKLYRWGTARAAERAAPADRLAAPEPGYG